MKREINIDSPGLDLRLQLFYLKCNDGTTIRSNDLTECLLLWVKYYNEEIGNPRSANSVGRFG